MRAANETKLLSVFDACLILGITEGAMRAKIARHRDNGLTTVIRKVRRRVFLDRDALMKWIDSCALKVD